MEAGVCPLDVPDPHAVNATSTMVVNIGANFILLVLFSNRSTVALAALL